MSRKTPLPLRVAPLQCVIAEPITDAAELAAIDKVRKREKRKQRAQQAKPDHQHAERHR